MELITEEVKQMVCDFVRIDGKSTDTFVEDINKFIESLATEDDKENATNAIVAIYISQIVGDDPSAEAWKDVLNQVNFSFIFLALLIIISLKGKMSCFRPSIKRKFLRLH